MSNFERAARNRSNFEDRFRGQGSYSSIDISVCACRHIHINSFVSEPLNATQIDVMKCIHWRTPDGHGRAGICLCSIYVLKNGFFFTKWRHIACPIDMIVSKNPSEAVYVYVISLRWQFVARIDGRPLYLSVPVRK